MKKSLRERMKIVYFPIGLLAGGMLGVFYGVILKIFSLAAFGVGCMFIGANMIFGPILVITGLVLKNTVMVTIGAILLIVIVCTVVSFCVINKLRDFYWKMMKLPTQSVRESYSYKGEKYSDAAAEEYRRLTGKPENAELTEEEKGFSKRETD